MNKKIISSLIVLCLLAPATACMAQEKNLAHLYKGKELKIFIKDITDESGNANFSTEAFRKELEEEFTNRKSIKFKIVENQNDADLEVSCTIKQYLYMEKCPINVTPSIGAMVFDTAVSSNLNFAQMKAYFTVNDIKTNKILWEDLVYNFVKKKMSEEESFSIIFDRIAREFVAKAFGKPKSIK